MKLAPSCEIFRDDVRSSSPSNLLCWTTRFDPTHCPCKMDRGLVWIWICCRSCPFESSAEVVGGDVPILGGTIILCGDDEGVHRRCDTSCPHPPSVHRRAPRPPVARE